METQKHFLLKEKVKKHLLKDFEEHEIFFEYKIIIDDKKYIIDAVAINPQRKIAIECGILNSVNRIETLSTFFDKVIHFPYLDCNTIKHSARSTRIELLMSKEMLRKIDLYAEKMYTTRSQVIRWAIFDFIKKHEVKNETK